MKPLAPVIRHGSSGPIKKSVVLDFTYNLLLVGDVRLSNWVDAQN
jgi:hypothetical protein